MIDKEQLQAIGTIIGAACAAALWWFTARREAKKPASPPPERPPSEHQVTAQLQALRDQIARNRQIDDGDRHDMERQLDRIERSLERLSDRLDADARIGSAIAKLRNHD